MSQVVPQERDVVAAIRDRLTRLDPEFKTALPKHIPAERFRRVAITAIQRNPDLALADQKSLFGACMLAAQDGLLPDGREAALVVFNVKNGSGGWIKQVQYMPMVFGIRKKVYQSGDIKALVARTVHENDDFDIELGDSERLYHKPDLTNRGKMIAAYAVATFKDGSKEFDVMTIAEIERVRQVSRSKDKGPWADWYEEMAKKTVIRRLAKNLPLSAELDDFMRRDDSFYDLDHRQAQQVRAVPQTIEARLDHFANGNEDPAEASRATAEGSESSPEDAAPEPESVSPPSSPADGEGDADSTSRAMSPDIQRAYNLGRAACKDGHTRVLPKNLKGKGEPANAFLRGWDDEANEADAAGSG